MTRKRRTLPKDPMPATIENLSHDGRGITHYQHKITFVEQALPGEEITFTYTKQHSKWDEGKLHSVIQSSPARVTPQCQHFNICGGCNLQHLHSEQQILHKQQVLAEQLQHIAGINLQHWLAPVTGATYGYRRKARLSVRYLAKIDKLLIGFHEKNGRYVAALDYCETLDIRAAKLIAPLQTVIRSLTLFQEIPQIEIAVGDEHVGIIVRHLRPLPAQDLTILHDFARAHQIYLYLQPSGYDSIHLSWPEATSDLLWYRLPKHNLQLHFHPCDFIQNNHLTNQALIELAITLLAPKSDETLLDLFCGLGNFTLPLAQHCQHIHGVELDERMVQRAKYNATFNNTVNADFFQADLTQTPDVGPWQQQKYAKILLDPPRTGAQAMIPTLIKMQPQRIVYVSCNPATLARDAGLLLQSQQYILQTAGVIDMFPHTKHVEAIALFIKHE